MSKRPPLPPSRMTGGGASQQKPSERGMRRSTSQAVIPPPQQRPKAPTRSKSQGDIMSRFGGGGLRISTPRLAPRAPLSTPKPGALQDKNYKDNWFQYLVLNHKERPIVIPDAAVGITIDGFRKSRDIRCYPEVIIAKMPDNTHVLHGKDTMGVKAVLNGLSSRGQAATVEYFIRRIDDNTDHFVKMTITRTSDDAVSQADIRRFAQTIEHNYLHTLPATQSDEISFHPFNIRIIIRARQQRRQSGQQGGAAKMG